MKISGIGFTKFLALSALSTTIAYGGNRGSGDINPTINRDSIEIRGKVPSEGTSDSLILSKSPNPSIYYMGEKRNAKIVVSVSDNVLYYYDNSGKPIRAYSVATGKSSTPTQPGVNMVSHVEKYPYLTAPRSTKRRRSPSSFGPHIIILDNVDVHTGERSMTGQFIHGNNDSTSIGKRVSNGCIRMSNKVINYLSKLVKRGDLVVIKK